MGHMQAGRVIEVRELADKQRDEARQTLTRLEAELVRRRRRLAYWTMRRAQAASMPTLPDSLRLETLHFCRRAEDLLAAGERLRAYLLVELQSQPAHGPAYHYAH